ncbi:MAG TPA: hypothetical protein VLJ79_31940 [Candidatus Binatia bacterium]|nr:hypothetical protein [Candidatus Binatia bacterium]
MLYAVGMGMIQKSGKEFRRRYFAELDGKQEAWEPILEAVNRGGAVLL